MENVIKFYKTQLASMSRCAAIRATAAEFIDVPRAEIKKIFVGKLKMNPATVASNVQAGRQQSNRTAPKAATKAATKKSVKPAARLHVLENMLGQAFSGKNGNGKNGNGKKAPTDIHSAVAANERKPSKAKATAAKRKASK